MICSHMLPADVSRVIGPDIPQDHRQAMSTGISHFRSMTATLLGRSSQAGPEWSGGLAETAAWNSVLP